LRKVERRKVRTGDLGWPVVVDGVVQPVLVATDCPSLGCTELARIEAFGDAQDDPTCEAVSVGDKYFDCGSGARISADDAVRHVSRSAVALPLHHKACSLSALVGAAVYSI
jgi:hypothetical protein